MSLEVHLVLRRPSLSRKRLLAHSSAAQAEAHRLNNEQLGPYHQLQLAAHSSLSHERRVLNLRLGANARHFASRSIPSFITIVYTYICMLLSFKYSAIQYSCADICVRTHFLRPPGCMYPRGSPTMHRLSCGRWWQTADANKDFDVLSTYVPVLVEVVSS